jgi:hypothetical protein
VAQWLDGSTTCSPIDIENATCRGLPRTGRKADFTGTTGQFPLCP